MFIKPIFFKPNGGGSNYQFKVQNDKEKSRITVLQKLARMENIRKAQAERWG